jgi:hypothetical protein
MGIDGSVVNWTLESSIQNSKLNIQLEEHP